jgi:putative transposase
VSVAPSTYYAAKSRGPSQRAQRDAVLGPALVQLWKDNYCVYGAHKLWKTARRAGHDVGRDQVARLMRAAGIQGVRRGKRVRTTKPDPGAGRHPDLVKRNFTATAPNQLWVTDLGRSGIRLLHHRRVQSDDRRLAGRVEHADHDGARRD